MHNKHTYTQQTHIHAHRERERERERERDMHVKRGKNPRTMSTPWKRSLTEIQWNKLTQTKT
jgi:hypothetical protein